MEQGLYRSRLFPLRGASARARYRAAAIRPCLGFAEVSQSDAERFTEMRRLPRLARLAIEARPLGRARAGPAEGRNSRERYKLSQRQNSIIQHYCGTK